MNIMKLKLDITPDLVAMMAAEIKAGERAVTAATREAGNSLKTAWRAQITGAGLGQRLARTIRAEQFPNRDTKKIPPDRLMRMADALSFAA